VLVSLAGLAYSFRKELGAGADRLVGRR
jgi:hypothetical protein